ncbi:hypothetical protein GRAN_1433 [Granulicella sibirica]|uniref:Uncharacterized protein n=1 Tax=Granulicella sibirica TaxID=2479048 RepID=A0A4Q0T3F4_9BACT|nr:hypothetical protein GRAN_1433 [Granulicella sibirica]
MDETDRLGRVRTLTLGAIRDEIDPNDMLNIAKITLNWAIRRTI